MNLSLKKLSFFMWNRKKMIQEKLLRRKLKYITKKDRVVSMNLSITIPTTPISMNMWPCQCPPVPTASRDTLYSWEVAMHRLQSRFAPISSQMEYSWDNVVLNNVVSNNVVSNHTVSDILDSK